MAKKVDRSASNKKVASAIINGVCYVLDPISSVTTHIVEMGVDIYKTRKVEELMAMDEDVKEFKAKINEKKKNNNEEER